MTHEVRGSECQRLALMFGNAVSFRLMAHSPNLILGICGVFYLKFVLTYDPDRVAGRFLFPIWFQDQQKCLRLLAVCYHAINFIIHNTLI